MNNFSYRIKQIIDYKQLSTRQFEQKIGSSNGVISKILLKNTDLSGIWLSKIIEKFPEVSSEWLLTGEGEMLKCVENFKQKNDVIEKNIEKNDILENVKVKKAKNNIEGIPLIPIEAMAGFGTGNMQVLEYECERYVIPMFRGADFLISVRGSSMIPKYNSGDVVACKKLSLDDIFFQWNKVYVLDTAQGALVKRIQKGSDKDHILIVSDNSAYSEFELHKSQIYSVAMVLGVIRLE